MDFTTHVSKLTNIVGKSVICDPE